MRPNTSGEADACTDATRPVGEMDLTEVRSLLERLLERRLLAPLHGGEQLLWTELIEREQQLLHGRLRPMG